MCNLGLFLIEILDLQSEKVAGRSEGETCTRGVVAEEGDAQSGIEDLAGNVAASQIAQRIRHGPDGFDFIVCFFPGKEEVTLVHFGNVERVQGADIIFQVHVIDIHLISPLYNVFLIDGS